MRTVLALLCLGWSFAAEPAATYCPLTIEIPQVQQTWVALAPGSLGRMAALLHADPALADLLHAAGVSRAPQWAAMLQRPFNQLDGMAAGLYQGTLVGQFKDSQNSGLVEAIHLMVPRRALSIAPHQTTAAVRLDGELLDLLVDLGHPTVGKFLTNDQPGHFTWEMHPSSEGTTDELHAQIAPLPLASLSPTAPALPSTAAIRLWLALDRGTLGPWLMQLIAQQPTATQEILNETLKKYGGPLVIGGALNGNWAVAVVPLGASAEWLVIGERKPDLDQLINTFLAENNAQLPNDGAPLLVPTWPGQPPLFIRQTTQQWLFGSAGSLLIQPESTPIGSFPPTARMHAIIDIARLWRVFSAGILVEAKKSPAMQRTSTAKAATLANRLATIAGSATVTISPPSAGNGINTETYLTATNGIAAAAALVSMFSAVQKNIDACLARQQAGDFEHRLGRLAQLVQNPHKLPLPAPWTDACVAWPAPVDALHEQPLAVIDPAITPDGRARVIQAHGSITCIPILRSAAVWKAAKTIIGPAPDQTISARAWAPVLALMGPGNGPTPMLPGPLVHGELNFLVRQLPHPWSQLDPREIKNASGVLFSHAKRGSVVAVVGESLSDQLDFEVKSLVANQLSHQRALTTAMEEDGEVTATIVGRKITGTRWRMTMIGTNQVQWRELYAFLTPDAGIQIIVSSSNRDNLAVDRAAICAAVVLLDPQRSEPAPPSPPFSALTLPGLNLRLDFPGWHSWPNRNITYPLSVAGALHHGTWWTLIAGVRLTGIDPQTDDLAQGLLATFDIPAGDPDLLRGESGKFGGQIWQEWTYTRHTEDGAYPFRLRTVREGNRAWIIGCWWDSEISQPPTDLKGLFEGVTQIADDGSSPTQVTCLQEARILNQAGLAAYNSERFREALTVFHSAIKLSPHDEEITSNICWTYARLSQPVDGLAFLDSHPELENKHFELRAFRASYLGTLDRRNEAITVWESLFREGYANREDFIAYMDLLWEADRHPDACAAPDRFTGPGNQRQVRLYQALLRSLDGQHEQAIAQYKTLVKAAPGETNARLQLGWALYRAERNTEALTAIEPVTNRSDATSEAWRLTGMCQLDSGSLQAAKTSLEKALAIAPGDQRAKDMLSHVNGQIGTGDNTALRTEVTALSLPEITAVPQDFSPEDDAAYLDRTTAFQWHVDQSVIRTERRIVHIRTSAGAGEFSKLEIRFDPRCEQLFVNRLVVTDANGKLVGEGRLSDYYLLDDNDGGQGTTKRIAHLPVPGLSPGCTLEWVVSRRSIDSPKTFPYQRISLNAGYPTWCARVLVSGDIAEIGSVTNSGITVVKDALHLEFLAQLPQVYRFESLADDDRRWLQIVEIGSLKGTWKEAGDEYLKKISQQLIHAALVKEVSDTVCDGIEERPAQCSALTAYVQRTLTYQAIEFGTRGTMPKPATASINDTFGDCKDHAVLLQQLLTKQGIASFLALANTQHEIEPSLVDLDQFNHMVVAVPEPNGEEFRIIDTTSKEADSTMQVSAGCAGKKLLLLDPAGPRLIQASDPAPSTITTKRTVRISIDGTLTIHEVVSIDRYFASWMRAWLRGIPTRERLARFQEYLGSDRAEVTAATVLNLDERNKPLVITVDYQPKERLTGTTEQRSGHLPAIWERANLDVRRIPGRRSPALLSYPLIVRSQVTIETPTDWKLTLRPATPDAGDPWFRYEEQLTSSGFTAETKQLRARIPAESWSAYCTRTADILQRLEAEVSISK